MGEVIRGPKRWWGQEVNLGANNYVDEGELIRRYPWYALSGPKGTKPKEYDAMLADLKRLVKTAGPEAQLQLPKGWFWDAQKFQALIDELNQIGEDEPDEPNDPEGDDTPPSCRVA